MEIDASFVWQAGLLIGAGLAAGFAGGLFGIGGGVIVVPCLYWVFQTLGVGDATSLKTAIGTSLGVIFITSFRALTTHHREGHVDMALLRAWVPWVAIGSAAGGILARWVPLEALAAMFIGGAIYFAWRRLTDRSENSAPTRDLTSGPLKIPLGVGTGLFSAMMGLGGGAAGVMVMTASGRAIHQAIATSAGIGMAVAGPGAVGFIWSGYGVSDLPLLSVGFFSLPAFVVLGFMVAIAAPAGARLAHRIDPVPLSRFFACYVLIAAGALAVDVFAP